MSNREHLRSRLFALVISLLLTLMLLLGCTSLPVGKFKTLDESNKLLLMKTSDTYTRIEKLQRYFAVVTAPNKEIDVNTFKLSIEGQGYDIAPELKFREAVFETIVHYTALLSSISSRDYQSEIDKASHSLAGSVKNLSDSAKIDGGINVSSIVGTFAEVVGGKIVEYQRRETLRKIMDKTQESLQELSSLLVGSNQKIKTFVSLAQRQIIAHDNAIRPGYGTAERLVFDLKVADNLAEIEDIIKALDTISAAVSEIPKAHKEIRAELDKKPTTIDSLQKLVQEAQNASKLYRDLNK